MNTQNTADTLRLNRKPKLLLVLCLVSFTLIQSHDAKWTLPLILWGWVGFAAGDGVTRTICGLFLISWMYLWTRLFQDKLQLDTKLVVPFLVLYGMALFEGYLLMDYYVSVGYVKPKAYYFIIPFIVFVISSVLLIRSLRRQ